MRIAIPVAAVALIVACSTIRPLSVRPGDICHGCKQVIAEPRYAAEIVAIDGQAFKFRTVGCLARYLTDHPEDLKSAVFVTDYKTGEFLRAGNATYVRATIDGQTGERNYVAYRFATDAALHAREQDTSAIDWPAVLRSIRAE